MGATTKQRPLIEVRADAVAEAQVRLDAIRGSRVDVAGRLRAAIVSGDADGAVAAQRALDEHPLRVLVAEVAHLNARAAEVEQRISDSKLDAAPVFTAADEADARWRKVADDHASTPAQVAHAEIDAREAARAAQDASQGIYDLRDRLAGLRKEIEAKVAPSPRDLAPVVRSLMHGGPRLDFAGNPR